MAKSKKKSDPQDISLQLPAVSEEQLQHVATWWPLAAALLVGCLASFLNIAPVWISADNWPIIRLFLIITNSAALWLSLTYIAARQPNLNSAYKHAALSLALLLFGYYTFALIWSSNVNINLSNTFPALLYWLGFGVAASFIFGRLGYLNNKEWWPISIVGITLAAEAIYKLSHTLAVLGQDPIYSIAWLGVALTGGVLISIGFNRRTKTTR